MEEFKGTNCVIFSRVVGYIRPINSWNEGKQEEFKLRKDFKVDPLKS